MRAGDLVVELVEEGAEEHKGVVLGADLCEAPSLTHGHAGIRCIVPQACTALQPCWDLGWRVRGVCVGGGGGRGLLLFHTSGTCTRQGRPVRCVAVAGGGGLFHGLGCCIMSIGAVPCAGVLSMAKECWSKQRGMLFYT